MAELFKLIGGGDRSGSDNFGMKIVFLAVNDEFAGGMQKYVYENHPEWVVGSVISTRPIYKRTKIGGLLLLLRTSGFMYLAQMIRMKITGNVLYRKNIATPEKLAKAYKVAIYYSHNINDAESLAQLAAWAPDIIISTNFSHYIADRARRSARSGTWNLHKSLLPHYRGMNPSFYALLNGEKKVGATLHKIAKGFDTGDILCQIEVPISDGDSVESLNRKTSDLGGKMLARYLEEVDLSDIRTTPQPQGMWPNYSYPTRLDIKVFRKMGRSF
jgi:folate-dependent phosphoribosylglycinamide formyltransferase PurN